MKHGALIPALILLASCASAATPSPEDAVEFRESQSSVGLDMPLDRSELTPGEMRPAFVCGAEVLGSRKPVAVDADSGKTVPLFSYDKIFLIPEGEAPDLVRVVKIRRDWDATGSYLGKNEMVYPEGRLTVELGYLCSVEELS